MSNVPSATPQHDPANPPPPAGADAFAADVQSFWEKNRNFILMLLAAVVFGLIGREGWQWFQASREADVQAAYAKAGSSADQLAKFAAEHSNHALAGVAQLRLADEAYGKNDFKSAAAGYAKAADALENDALKSRARLGAAMSQLSAGDKAAGETALKALVADTKAAPASRSEAAYHLAILAKDAGRRDDALKQIEEITKLDAAGIWAQRAIGLRNQIDLENPAAPAAGGSPAVEFKPKG